MAAISGEHTDPHCNSCAELLISRLDAQVVFPRPTPLLFGPKQRSNNPIYVQSDESPELVDTKHAMCEFPLSFFLSFLG